MKLIPVIDLLDGFAVHARFGDRARYQRLQSPLCNKGEVLPLVRRLTEAFHLSTLYVADLNAILDRGDNIDPLRSILSAFPRLTIWIDAGLRSTAALDKFIEQFPAMPVIGTETWRAPSRIECDRFVLSIDHDTEGLRDPSGIHAHPEHWPGDVILMNLKRVGSNQGPDVAQLDTYARNFPQQRFFAAGGVRNRADLKKLQAAGASGVLLASALHQGHLSATDIRNFS